MTEKEFIELASERKIAAEMKLNERLKVRGTLIEGDPVDEAIIKECNEANALFHEAAKLAQQSLGY